MADPSMPHTCGPTTTRVLTALALLAVLMVTASGCGSGSTPSATEPTSPPSAQGPTRTPTTAPDTGGGQVVTAAEVTCHQAKRGQGGPIMSDDGAVEVACTSRHNQESFTLSGTDQLDDCYRAVAASSDVTISTDEFDSGKLDFSDGRIQGHAFATTTGSEPDGSAVGLTCAVDLRDDRTGSLIGG